MLNNNVYYTLPNTNAVFKAKFMDNIWQLIDVNRSYSVSQDDAKMAGILPYTIVYCLIPNGKELHYVEYMRQDGKMTELDHRVTKWVIDNLVECKVKKIKVF